MIRNYRIKSGLTGSQLARDAGVSECMISLLEADKKSPSLTSLDKICNAMNLTIGELFLNKEYESPTEHEELYFDILMLTPQQQEVLIRIIKHINEKRGRRYKRSRRD
jgi:transcriptional regulator with XRE-family HTH domain